MTKRKRGEKVLKMIQPIRDDTTKRGEREREKERETRRERDRCPAATKDAKILALCDQPPGNRITITLCDSDVNNNNSNNNKE